MGHQIFGFGSVARVSRAQVLVQELREVRVAAPRSLDSCKKHSDMRIVGGISPTSIQLFAFGVDRDIGTFFFVGTVLY